LVDLESSPQMDLLEATQLIDQVEALVEEELLSSMLEPFQIQDLLLQLVELGGLEPIVAEQVEQDQ
jgi:hypothetical protein